jgi:hypothetical protein
VARAHEELLLTHKALAAAVRRERAAREKLEHLRGPRNSAPAREARREAVRAERKLEALLNPEPERFGELLKGALK